MDPNNGLDAKMLGVLGSKLNLAMFMQWKWEDKCPQDLSITEWLLQRQNSPTWGKGHADRLASPVSLDNDPVTFNDNEKINLEQILKCTFRK